MITSTMSLRRFSVLTFSIMVLLCLGGASVTAQESTPDSDRIRIYRAADGVQDALQVRPYYLVHYLTRDLFVVPQFRIRDHMDFEQMAFFAGVVRDHVAEGLPVTLQVVLDEPGTLSFRYVMEDNLLWMVSNYVPSEDRVMRSDADASEVYARQYEIRNGVLARPGSVSDTDAPDARQEAPDAREAADALEAADRFIFDTNGANDIRVPDLLDRAEDAGDELEGEEAMLHSYILTLTRAQYAMLTRDLLTATNAVSRASAMLDNHASLAPYEPLFILAGLELEVLRALLLADARASAGE